MKRFQRDGHGNRKEGSGCLKVTSIREDRMIVLKALQTSTIIRDELRRECQLEHVSRNTTARRLADFGGLESY